ncbi:sec-independent protein translocase protein TatA [Amycolatopsis bartoniae]|uniref:Sec-independent protein translocase protein TatA n=1 Tax=Amycolatopsis bartoniae TaxID=941986 RepID=A0A8H9M4X1_9PSEU|nr:Sec-independent protein translocase subunit TatA [Amycolatopsis bartoniae]MBB2937009.1 sec-independent protein translocase protein TatA [Amycolatopsis bartoniae]TVT06410.1 twin-arginine translocase TatA/TatE family subunit [Amycolatopsis bartoniae]GHF51802.1 sec-independent protein translocase protein TatA [Amycolatopsis bartoniae]
MLNGLQPWHLIILVLIVVLLFGAKRLPDAARSIGKSMKIFKAETKDMHNESAAEPEKRELPAATAQSAADQQVAELQRQLDELKRQQEQQKHAS